MYVYRGVGMKESERESLVRKIEGARRTLGWSKGRLANELGIHQTSICSWYHVGGSTPKTIYLKFLQLVCRTSPQEYENFKAGAGW